MPHFSQRETFEFDLNGYIVLKQFFTPQQVDAMNQAVDRSAQATNVHKFRFCTLDEIFLDVIADDRILELCHRWVHPYFRFDHAWGVQHFPHDGYANENIHGGQFAEQSFFQYHWNGNRPVCSCLIFSVILEPQHAGDGGLIMVPGSHKSNIGMDGGEVYRYLLNKDLKDVPWVVQPVLMPGDLLIFTEAVMHGTAQWKPTERRRRNLYLKYAQGGMGWLPQNGEEIAYLRSKARNEQEQLLFRPSYVSPTDGVDGAIQWREPTYLKMRDSLKNKVGRKLKRQLDGYMESLG